MKVTKTQTGRTVIELNAEETVFLHVTLDRYTHGKAAMDTENKPEKVVSEGFPTDLLKEIEKI